MNKIMEFIRLPMQVKWMLLEVLFLSAKYRRQMLYQPFAEISPAIGTLGLETDRNSADDPVVFHVRRAIDIVCKRTIWESMCMVRALTAKKMLNRRGFPCTLYMGVAKDSDGKMIAHAWCRCGKIYVTGGNGHKKYTVTAIYGS